MRPNSIYHPALKAWTAAGLAPIGLHEARHTFASMMIASGATPLAISRAMGHSSISVTFNTYGHLLPGERDELRKRLDAFLDSA